MQITVWDISVLLWIKRGRPSVYPLPIDKLCWHMNYLRKYDCVIYNPKPSRTYMYLDRELTIKGKWILFRCSE